MNYLNSRLDKWCAKCQINDLLYSSNCAYSDEEGKNSATGISHYVSKRDWIYVEREDPQRNKFKAPPKNRVGF